MPGVSPFSQEPKALQAEDSDNAPSERALSEDDPSEESPSEEDPSEEDPEASSSGETDLLGRFLDSPGYKPKTKDGYRHDIEAFFKEMLGAETATPSAVRRATRKDVLDYLRAEAEEVSYQTLRRRVVSLRAFSQWLREEGPSRRRLFFEEEGAATLADRIEKETEAEEPPGLPENYRGLPSWVLDRFKELPYRKAAGTRSEIELRDLPREIRGRLLYLEEMARTDRSTEELPCSWKGGLRIEAEDETLTVDICYALGQSQSSDQEDTNRLETYRSQNRVEVRLKSDRLRALAKKAPDPSVLVQSPVIGLLRLLGEGPWSLPDDLADQLWITAGFSPSRLPPTPARDPIQIWTSPSPENGGSLMVYESVAAEVTAALARGAGMDKGRLTHLRLYEDLRSSDPELGVL